jgi:hypothetical protein
MDGRGFDSPQGQGIFLYSTASRPALGPTQPPTQCVPGALSSGLKQPGHEADHSGLKQPGNEADHSPPSNAEIKNAGSIPPLPHTF